MEDVKTWVDLKLQILQLDVEERIETALNRVVFAVIFGVLGFTTLIFLLFTIAFFLGGLWYSDTLGFLTVTIFLLVATLAFRAMRPSLVKLRDLREVSRDAVESPRSMPGLPPAASGPGPTGKAGAGTSGPAEPVKA